MNGIRIRPTIPTDIPDLARILISVHETDGYPVEGVSEASDWIATPNAIGQWTALLADEPVGHVALVPIDPQGPYLSLFSEHACGDAIDNAAEVCRLFVAPAARGRSIGAQLMHTAEVAARERAIRVVLEVMKKDKAAIRLYEARGWRTCGETTHTFGAGGQEPALIMSGPIGSDEAKKSQ